MNARAFAAALVALVVTAICGGDAGANPTWQVTGSNYDLIIGSNATVDNNLTVDGVLAVTGSATLSSTLAVTTSITIGGSAVPVYTSSTGSDLPLWTASGVLGNSAFTDSGTTGGIGANFLVTESTGHFVGASGGYVTGDLGLSNAAAAFTPGTVLDIRTNNTTPLEIFNYASSTSGAKVLIGKGRGVIGTITGDLVGDAVMSLVVYGYDSSAAINENALIQTNIDQTVSAGVVPSNFDVSLEDNGGTLRHRFRVDSGGHVVYPTITSPTATSCGTGPTVAGNDNIGDVVVGTGATGCTITFALPFSTPSPSSTAICSVTNPAVAFSYTTSNTAITIVSSAASSTTFTWMCGGT